MCVVAYNNCWDKNSLHVGKGKGFGHGRHALRDDFVFAHNSDIMSTSFHNFWLTYTTGNLQLGGVIINPPNAFYATL